MKVRNGFVSNSSSSSFIVCSKKWIGTKQEVLEYLKAHDKCVGYLVGVVGDCGVYFDIESKFRKAILDHADDIEVWPTIVEGFHCLDEEFKITEDMVGAEVSIQSGWDGDGCDRYYSYGKIVDGVYEGIFDAIFGALPGDEYDSLVAILEGYMSN